MGIFNVEISVGDTERQHWLEVSATVDTASFVSSVPGSLLRELGLAPIMNQPFRMADGTLRNMDVAYTWIRVNDREVMTHIAFNEEYTSPLLGSLALETLLLGVDPVDGKLVPWPFIQDYSSILPEK